MPESNVSYIGVGKVHVRPYGSTAARRYVGNVSEALLKQELDIKKQKDYTRLGGGTAQQVERLEAVSIEMTWLSFSPSNLALAVSGTTSNVVGATITDEVVKGYKDSTVRLAHPPSAITSVKDAATGLITYVAGTHYEMSAGGLYFPAASTIVDAADLEVTYTHAAYDKVEAAMQTSSEVELLFEGLNEADSGKSVIVDVWRARFPSAAELALIGDDFGEMKFTAELQKDSTKGAGVSAFFRVQKVA